ncbi:MAG: DUF2891 domain-containing protein [Phycisphaerales bacterium]|nr:DUF2891 domain-containing protein [Phycisphaerales bacterium]MCB9857225.1 DUF2891 domain-containing protein [Phycisphaerales bacterium]MCB9863061.1 DUF2891 domain-containing protein [Phycisphaerales bacterium]
MPVRADEPSQDIADNLALVTPFADMAMDCVHKPYPYKLSHVLNSDADAQTPRQLTPIFYGCFDWHSAVHGHWMLVRLIRLYPEAPFADRARALIAESFTKDNVAGEVAYISGKGRNSFERPYGLAWFLQLSAELHEWDDPQARDWAATLEPLEAIAVKRLTDWLPKLSHPVRTGTHDQTAFALGLIYDWAKRRGNNDVLRLVEERARHFYLRDRGANLAFEPSGHDFLSPAIAEADVMRRILKPVEFAAWLGAFLPELPVDGSANWLPIAVVTDRSDGHLVHLDGLNSSRAWMLEGIAAGLPIGDPRIEGIRKTAALHRKAALEALKHQEYEGGHWLGSFATYLVTRRGMSN